MLNTPKVWSQVVAALEPHAHCLILDVTHQASIAEMARDALDLMGDVPRGRRVVGCGFSMGGYVLIEMLVNAGWKPDAAVFLSTSAQPETEEGRTGREKTIAAIERDYEKVIQNVAKFGTAATSHSNQPLMQCIVDMMRQVEPQAAIRQNRAIAERRDSREALAVLDVATLVACGREDRITMPSLSEELAKLIPGARIEWIDRAGHMTPMEAPEEVAALLKSLL
ncbi:MAG: alpha/beta hydrolase [Variovorax paradoxus]|uniref:Alpha/beta hydrolase n=1 Tax=Variovorax paradoxus TaxID=34073 RepID=A0A2W5QT42_VARPD|nr:MAG: alpha/beta hydrolase [Variovorax paradoxus]